MANTRAACLSVSVHALYHYCDFQAQLCPNKLHWIFWLAAVKFVLLWYRLFTLIYQCFYYFRHRFLNDLLVSLCLKKPFLSLWEASIKPGVATKKNCQFFVSWHCVSKILWLFTWCVFFWKNSLLRKLPTRNFVLKFFSTWVKSVRSLW